MAKILHLPPDPSVVELVKAFNLEQLKFMVDTFPMFDHWTRVHIRREIKRREAAVADSTGETPLLPPAGVMTGQPRPPSKEEESAPEDLPDSAQ